MTFQDEAMRDIVRGWLPLPLADFRSHRTDVVGAKAKGHAPRSATFTPAEGATKEIELVLDKQ